MGFSFPPYLVQIGFACIAMLFCCLEKFLVKNKIAKTCLFGGLILIYLLLSVLKSDAVGIDSEAYTKMYVEITSKSFLGVMKAKFPECGFYGLMYACAALHLPKIAFDFICFSIISACIWIALWKDENKCFKFTIFMFIGFLVMSFSGIRQAVAMAIVSLAISIYIKTDDVTPKKVIIYCVLCFLAALFHTTALVAFAVPLILLIKIKDYQYPWLSIMFLVLPFILGHLYSYFGVLINENYLPASARVSLTMIIFILLILAYYLLYTMKGFDAKEKLGFKRTEYTKRTKNLILLMYLSAFFMAFNTATMVVTRIAMYFYLSSAEFIFEFVDNNKHKTVNKILYVAVLVIFALFFIYNVGRVQQQVYVIRTL